GLETVGVGRPPRAAGPDALLTLSGLLRYAADQAPEVYRAARARELERRGVALAAEPWGEGALGRLERRGGGPRGGGRARGAGAAAVGRVRLPRGTARRPARGRRRRPVGTSGDDGAGSDRGSHVIAEVIATGSVLLVGADPPRSRALRSRQESDLDRSGQTV